MYCEGETRCQHLHRRTWQSLRGREGTNVEVRAELSQAVDESVSHSGVLVVDQRRNHAQDDTQLSLHLRSDTLGDARNGPGFRKRYEISSHGYG